MWEDPAELQVELKMTDKKLQKEAKKTKKLLTQAEALQDITLEEVQQEWARIETKRQEAMSEVETFAKIINVRLLPFCAQLVSCSKQALNKQFKDRVSLRLRFWVHEAHCCPPDTGFPRSKEGHGSTRARCFSLLSQCSRLSRSVFVGLPR